MIVVSVTLNKKVSDTLDEIRLVSIDKLLKNARSACLHFESGLASPMLKLLLWQRQKKLPPEPAYGEWLVLLDRGDLIAR